MSSPDDAEPGPHFSLARDVLHIAAIILGFVATGAMVLAAAAVFILHLTVQPVLSGSMRPTFDPGAAIITRPVATRSIRPGDVIAFIPPGHVSSFAHRVTSVSGPVDRPVITTKGDANPAADPWHAQIAAPSVSQVIGSIPGLGRVVVVVEQSGARLWLIVAAGLVICAVGTKSILTPPSPAPSPAC